MHVNSLLLAFGRGHYIGDTVSVHVREDGILGRRHLTDGDGGPRLGDLVRARIQISADNSRLLPSCRDVEQAIAVCVGKPNTVSALPGGIDLVPRPRGGGKRSRQQQVCECHPCHVAGL